MRCQRCNGLGWLPNRELSDGMVTGRDTCPRCDGTGLAPVQDDNFVHGPPDFPGQFPEPLVSRLTGMAMARDEGWWADGSMVNEGAAGDERFIGDAATEEDAQRITDAHNGTDAPAAAEPIDPERLARAMSTVLVPQSNAWCRRVAPRIAAAYNAGAVPGTETEPENERRSTGATESAWLIERGQPEGLDWPEWWGVSDPRTGAHSFLRDAWRADRFPSRQAAEAEIARLNPDPVHPFRARAVEHGFITENAKAAGSTAVGRDVR